MKNLTSKILLLTLLIIATTCAGFSQEPNSRNATASPTPAPTETVKVSRGKTVAFLIEQNKNACEVIALQERRITDLEAELAAEKENSASLGKSYESAKNEIASLKESNAALARAVKINEGTIALLQEDNAKQRAKADKANKEKWKARVIAVIAIASRFIF